MQNALKKKQDISYHLNGDGSFVIEDYQQCKPFSNFFPGIAGLWGIPMWVFYVNRGQCISSFGIEGKDKSILEFQPANKAYRLTSLQGFRTFIKIKTGKKTIFWEPFQHNLNSLHYKTQQKMSLTSHDLTIEETNATLGLSVKVNYFTIAQEDFPALVRRVTIKNTSQKKYSLELVDGLPAIMPYGVKDWLIKNLSRIVEAWYKVNNLKNKAPFYHLNVEVSDTPTVTHITEGNFYFSFEKGAKRLKLLDPLVDAASVFGRLTDFSFPEKFLAEENYQIPPQQTRNRTSCAMSFTKFNLPKKDVKEIISLAGYAHSEHHLKKIVRRCTAKGFIEKKAQVNQETIAHIKNYALTNSSSPEFNMYSSQTFLDNVMRGGLPVSLKTREGNIPLNIFSRKHGDLEREYNYFVLSPTYLSQGNGNYRDVNQNRRNDVWFNKDVLDHNIMTFLNLIQVDGYNPLVVKGITFSFKNPSRITRILNQCINGDSQTIRKKLLGNFQPGDILSCIAQNGIHLKVPAEEFLGRILSASHQQSLADHGEGYWSDHWTYNLDLIKSYLALYPEQCQDLLVDKKSFTFYHNAHYVLPRAKRYLLTKNGVRQYHSVAAGAQGMKAGNQLRTQNGEGDIYHTTLIAKLLCLITNKAATFDPDGIGIEMEADKPGWYDSLNGLPGLLGSSICETLELKRLCVFLLGALNRMDLGDDYSIRVFSELVTFMEKLKDILSLDKDALDCWHTVNDAKEQFRTHVRAGIDGTEFDMRLRDVREFLRLVIARTDRAVERAKDDRGLIRTYFYYEVTDYAKLNKKHQDDPYVLPITFKRHSLPLFLEGFVHALRIEKDRRAAKRLYCQIRDSELFDKKLKMYKVNADLSGQSEEIGRTRIFPAGWLENESIWLHMEYKYLLELLRCKLYEEFYITFKEVLVPFLKPEQYGRSTLENSSFIVSSAHEDESLHGQGFVPRLSGSTAEFIHIWLLMNVGKKPFFINRENELNLSFHPVLAGWLFTQQETVIDYFNKKKKWQKIKLPPDTYAFNFMGSILTVYHNPKRHDTFGKRRCEIKGMDLTYPQKKNSVKIVGSIIPAEHAENIRNQTVDRIDVYFE